MPRNQDNIHKIPDFDQVQRKTNYAQIKLPSLPVPDLAETLERYLLCVKPIVPDVQFEKTKQVVENFGSPGGVGEKLQEHLLKKSASEINWSYDWWLEDMYLRNQAALPVNSSPGMVLPRMTFANKSEWIRFSGKLVLEVMKCKKTLDAKNLPVDIARGQLAGQPLCMRQYYRLFSSSRLPGKEMDRQCINEKGQNREHFIVSISNQFFVLYVTNDNGEIATEETIVAQIHSIVYESLKRKLPEPVGVLTSLGRSEWSEVRNCLLQKDINRKSVEMLETCVAVLCLDRTAANCRSDTDLAHQMLHGAGAYNRWYDKTMQFIVDSDGAIGLVYEHSASEGITVIRLVEEVFQTISEVDLSEEIDETKAAAQPERLEWDLENIKIKKYMELGRTALGKLAHNLDMKILRFTDYGKNFIKRQNMSPDAYIQISLQLAYYQVYGHLVSTYESASTRRFRHGRVDNIRAATVQVLELAKSLYSQKGNSAKGKLDAHNMMLLQRAAKAQNDYTIAAISGRGIDCHLIGLREIAKELGMDIPEIFSDHSFDICNYFTLSTSQVPTVSDSFMCYGAVVEDGYGVSYNPHSDYITFCVASYRSCSSTSSEKLASAILQNLRQMQDLCRQWNRRRSSSLETRKVPRKQAINREISARSYSVENDDLRQRLSRSDQRQKRHACLHERYEISNSEASITSRTHFGRSQFKSELNAEASEVEIPKTKTQHCPRADSNRRWGGVLVRERMHVEMSRRLSAEHIAHSRKLQQEAEDLDATSKVY